MVFRNINWMSIGINLKKFHLLFKERSLMF